MTAGTLLMGALILFVGLFVGFMVGIAAASGKLAEQIKANVYRRNAEYLKELMGQGEQG